MRILIIAILSILLLSCEESSQKLRWNRYTLECKNVYGQTTTRIFDVPDGSIFYSGLTNNRYTLDCISKGRPFDFGRSNYSHLAYDIIEVKIINIDSSKNFIHYW